MDCASDRVQPKLVTPVLQVVHRLITRFLLDQVGLRADEADNGAVTLIQRFGSAANLKMNVHPPSAPVKSVHRLHRRLPGRRAGNNAIMAAILPGAPG